jgi:protein-S-isoprenylcysteine O-methyltransferase Ste14
MILMTFIFLGILGFVLFHLVDLAAIWRMPVIKPLLWCGGCLLVIYSSVRVSLSSPHFELPAWVVNLGWFIFVISLFQVFFSLFINLPFRKTYLETGAGDELITTGLYGLVRHPGVWGLGALLAALILVSHSRLMFVAAPVWLITDVLVVTVQDYLFFSRMFPGYKAYRVRTPMLIPHRHDLVDAFFRLGQINHPRGGN